MKVCQQSVAYCMELTTQCPEVPLEIYLVDDMLTALTTLLLQVTEGKCMCLCMCVF
jgi:hypothetical protein